MKFILVHFLNLFYLFSNFINLIFKSFGFFVEGGLLLCSPFRILKLLLFFLKVSQIFLDYLYFFIDLSISIFNWGLGIDQSINSSLNWSNLFLILVIALVCTSFLSIYFKPWYLIQKWIDIGLLLFGHVSQWHFRWQLLFLPDQLLIGHFLVLLLFLLGWLLFQILNLPFVFPDLILNVIDASLVVGLIVL